MSEVKEMAECMDGEWEVEQIEKEQAQFPSFEDIRAMRIQLAACVSISAEPA